MYGLSMQQLLLEACQPGLDDGEYGLIQSFETAAGIYLGAGASEHQPETTEESMHHQRLIAQMLQRGLLEEHAADGNVIYYAVTPAGRTFIGL